MELNFSKLDNITSQNPYEQLNNNDYGVDNNSDNYWENAKSKKEQTKRKKVSFNDILSNMNLVVDKKGLLVSMRQTQTIEPQQQDYQYEEEYVSQQPNTQQKQYVPQQPIDPSVKHSYIYNKYFKDYADSNPEKPGPRVPKTIEEYHEMLLEDKIKQIQHRKLIEEVKSKKMMFTSAPGASLNPRNLQATRNNLRMMNFR